MKQTIKNVKVKHLSKQSKQYKKSQSTKRKKPESKINFQALDSAFSFGEYRGR